MEGITPDQMQQYRDAFSLFDKDQDGFISVEEFGSVIKQIGLTYSDKEVIEMVDMAGSEGKIDMTQFVHLMIGKVKGAPTEEDFLKAFQVYDHSKSGRVNSIELKHILRTLGEILTMDEINQLISEADPAQIGEFDYKEFTKKIFAVN
jgi:calmodulin